MRFSDQCKVEIVDLETGQTIKEKYMPLSSAGVYVNDMVTNLVFYYPRRRAFVRVIPVDPEITY